MDTSTIEVTLSYSRVVQLGRELSSAVRHALTMWPDEPMEDLIFAGVYTFRLEYKSPADFAAVEAMVWSLLDEYR